MLFLGWRRAEEPCQWSVGREALLFVRPGAMWADRRVGGQDISVLRAEGRSTEMRTYHGFCDVRVHMEDASSNPTGCGAGRPKSLRPEAWTDQEHLQ